MWSFHIFASLSVELKKPISPLLTLLGLHLQQVMMLHVLLIISRAEHCTLRFRDNHKGMLRHSTRATLPVSLNVAKWVRGMALISKRAEVTLLHSSSGPLSLIANRLSVCRWHAKHPCMTRIMWEQLVTYSPHAPHDSIPESDSCQPVCFVLRKVVWSMLLLNGGHALCKPLAWHDATVANCKLQSPNCPHL